MWRHAGRAGRKESGREAASSPGEGMAVWGESAALGREQRAGFGDTFFPGSLS